MFIEYQHDFKSSRPDVFCKIGVLKNVAKLTGKQLCCSLFFNKFAGLQPATLLINRIQQRCSSVTFAKFLERLLLWFNLHIFSLRITFLSNFGDWALSWNICLVNVFFFFFDLAVVNANLTEHLPWRHSQPLAFSMNSLYILK